MAAPVVGCDNRGGVLNSWLGAAVAASSHESTTELDLRCLEFERGVNVLLDVNVPRTIKITLGSGVGDHIVGREQVGSKSIRPSTGSRRGLHFIAANGDRIENEGESED